ncbi:Ubiquinone biosynthesis protein COQ9, mitochondrial [Nymphon striatum]|nr:Ubiquinone biosynthesis protein COQ9, mitochondrial [Nymphon striatum]
MPTGCCVPICIFTYQSLRHNSGQQNVTNKANSTEANSEKGHQEQQKDEADTTKDRILNASMSFVHDNGWTVEALANGSKKIGLSVSAHGMFPRGGIELVEFFYSQCNNKLVDHLKINKPDQELEIFHPAVREVLEMRLRMNTDYIEKWPQAMALMALPQNAIKSIQNLTHLVDEICYHTGDRSADMSWYFKRMSLASVYKATECCLVQDHSDDYSETWKFLDRRLMELKQCDKAVNKTRANLKNFFDILEGGATVVQNILSMNKAR